MNWSKMFREIIAFYSAIYAKLIKYMVVVTEEFLMRKQVAHMVTAVFQKSQ
jgi:hypothetical protein